jgi:hypothetical protein
MTLLMKKERQDLRKELINNKDVATSFTFDMGICGSLSILYGSNRVGSHVTTLYLSHPFNVHIGIGSCKFIKGYGDVSDSELQVIRSTL